MRNLPDNSSAADVPPARHVRAIAATSILAIGLFIVLALTSCSSNTQASVEAAASPTDATGSAKHTVVAVGDIACDAATPPTGDACEQAAVAERVTKISPAAVLLLGDIQYPKGALNDFRSSFEQSWGGLKPFLRPVPGNHEYATPKAAGYYGFFGARAGDPKAGYYSFNASGWHFVALNSNCGFVSCAAGSEQVKWLRADLAKNHRKCVAAFWHEPLFSSGEHGNSPVVKPFWSELRKAGAEIVLNGHDHDYERFAPQDENGKLDRKRGVREFVVGTGGRSHYGIKTRQPHSQFATANEFGVLALELTRRGMKWRFVTARGETLDRGSTRCH